MLSSIVKRNFQQLCRFFHQSLITIKQGAPNVFVMHRSRTHLNSVLATAGECVLHFEGGSI